MATKYYAWGKKLANFVSVLANVGHLFKVGWERAAAFEANPKVQAAEQGAVAVISVIDPPLGASIMAFFGIFIKVEQMSTALGAPKGNGLLKLQASLPEFEQMILALPIFKGKEIPDPEKFNKALIQAASGLVDIMNSFKSAAPVAVETVPPISVPGEGKDDRLRVSNVSRTLTALVKAEEVHLMLLSQLSKPNGPARPPRLADLRETGQLENDAHIVLLLHRPWDEQTGGNSNEAEIIIPKQRNGPTGTLPSAFNPSTLTFE